jgi:hypothetical protein
MATVVLIHAPEDATPARALGDKLRQARLNVVLGLPAGPELRQALTGAPVTLALWSPNALRDPAIVDDVTYARAASKVVHATMQNAPVPELFAGEPAVNLTGWRGQDDFGPWRQLAAIVAREAGVDPLPEPRPRASSGFFQPGRVAADANAEPRSASVHPFPAAPPPRPAAPPPRAAEPPQTLPTREDVFAYADSADWRSAAANHPVRDRDPPLPLDSSDGGGRAAFIAVLVIALGAIGGGGIWFLTQQSSATSAVAWATVDQSDPASLRAFMDNHQGALHDQAEQTYEALEQTRYQQARGADTIEALQAFITDFPDSPRFGLSARGRIAELRTAPPTTDEVAPTSEEMAPVDPDLLPPGATTEGGETPPFSPPSFSGPVPLGAAPAEPEPDPAPAPSTAPEPVDLTAPIQTN